MPRYLFSRESFPAQLVTPALDQAKDFRIALRRQFSKLRYYEH